MKTDSLPGICAICALLLAACAPVPPGWAEYREAMRCHLENKDTECDAAYEKAIAKNARLPGVHASYGSHLFRRGDAAAARAQFDAELVNHPLSRPAILIVLKERRDSAATSRHSETEMGR
jgi:hypothetical protein